MIVTMGTGEVMWRRDAMQVAKVCRALFGTPSRDENLQFAKEELGQARDCDGKRWNFDFVRERPLPGRYSWSRLTQSDPEDYTTRSSGPGVVVEEDDDREECLLQDRLSGGASEVRLGEDATALERRGGSASHRQLRLLRPNRTQVERQAKLTDFLRKRKASSTGKKLSSKATKNAQKLPRRMSS